MADTLTINTDDTTPVATSWIVHYEADNRQKRIERDTSVNPTAILKVNLLYSALQNHFDELTQMDDGSPMSAQTPTEYTIGIIDAGDKDPWFIDRTSVEYLKGGAIKTTSWLRNDSVQGGADNTGIVRIAYTTTTALDPTDIGRDILSAHADADRGTILDYNATGATKYMWIRPDTSNVTNSFDATATFTIPTEDAGHVWQFTSIGSVYTDITAVFNSAATGDTDPFPTPGDANGDAMIVGFRQKFGKLTYTVGTAGVGGTVDWEYWNGAWVALTGGSTATEDFLATGARTLTFTVPTDWVAKSESTSAVLYFIRAKVTDPYETNPILDVGAIGTFGVGSISAVASSGESLWANIYNTGLANIEKFTHQYVYQNGSILTKYKSTTVDWWGDQTTGETSDQIDILINIKELGVESDEGYVTVLARVYGKTYDNFIVDLTAGGRNPIPLATGADLNNTTGYRQFTAVTDSGSGTFNVNNFIYVGATWATATKRGTITKVAGTSGASSEPVIDYYLIGDLTDFVNTDAVKEYTGTADGDGTCTAQAPVDVGPALITTITALHANNSTEFDIDEVTPKENYSIVVDLVSTYTVAQGYEWSKYVTRRGFTTPDTFTDNINGEAYIGSDYRILYTTLTGTISEGGTVTQVSTLATGTVVAHHTAGTGAQGKILILRNSRGTFNNTDEVRVIVGTDANKVTGITTTSLAPIKSAPFGTFAGGTWFGAPGVVFKNALTTEANKYQLTDDNGNVVKAPTKVTITVGNTKANDKVAVFRLTAALGSIKKTPDGDPRGAYNATVQAIGATTVVVGANIAVDEPGKTLGGVLRLVDTSASTEYRIRFASWTTATFTLAFQTSLAANGSGCTATQITDTGTSFDTTVKVGDIIRNITENKIAYVTTVTSDTVLQTTPVTDWTSDSYEINTLPVATTTTPQDTIYVPLIDSFETADGTETASVTYSADIPVRVRARRTTATAILPYEADSTVTTAGMSSNIIRTPDTIFT